VTEEGKAALVEWLRSPVTTPLKFRDEGVLRLYFADELSREEQLRLVWRIRERARASELELRENILPLADPLDEKGIAFPGIVAKLGVDTFAYVEQWLGRLEAELEEPRPQD